ncbi:MAG: Flp family type IVb pilin [Smithella sp.]|nr:Flp family type IVb pilin [Smithella sp.]MDM7987569.1 Flp family type IVb pilin [Smithella sp.]
MMKAIKRFFKGEEGVTAIEYALIAAGIAIAIVIVVFAVGTQINSAFQCIVDCLGGGS